MELKMQHEFKELVDYDPDAFGLVGRGRFGHVDDIYFDLTIAETNAPMPAGESGRQETNFVTYAPSQNSSSLTVIDRGLRGLGATWPSLREFICCAHARRDLIRAWPDGLISPRPAWQSYSYVFVPWFVWQDGRTVLTLRNLHRPVTAALLILTKPSV